MLSDSDIKAAKRWVKETLARVPDEREPKEYHGAHVELATWLKGYMDFVMMLQAKLVLHPDGQCTCYGEGRCDFCRRCDAEEAVEDVRSIAKGWADRTHKLEDLIEQFKKLEPLEYSARYKEMMRFRDEEISRADTAEARVKKLEERNKELYEAMQIAENVGVDEGLFDEEERMTERVELPLTTMGKLSCELAEKDDDESAH